MILPESSDPTNGIEFVVLSVVLGLLGWVMGRAVNAAVGTKGQQPTLAGMAPRMLINAIALYVLYLALPWSVVYHLQNTLPGTVFCASFFGTQQWA
jgi:hypothetical protein